MYSLKWHKNLSEEKWFNRSRGQQVLMIANELNRAKNHIVTGRTDSVNECYERAFELTDLTSSDPKWRGKLKELRRFREVLAMQYTAEKKDIRMNTLLYIHLIRLSAEASRLLFPAKTIPK
ncbi:MAG TPA: hypothetical protein ENK44_14675 [Caldithrix abyssi]|uniref:Four helix bundle protein n=1 Tax=Caldithrix abyssi TaxID=187145 RepID=A0A7V4U2Q0_CALAY|nr:hypothetical protein [Caldithrix abyssi]